jgi:crotonobetainyl-CoA:carnitine CoA-transferase CaiB-like acyl-CoA transferase
MSSNLAPAAALASLWRGAALPAVALERVTLTGAEPVLPSSFAAGTAAQVSTAAAALAATEIGRLRNGLVQEVAVDMRHAALECCAFFTVDGKRLELWDKLAGLYRCKDGWVRLHTNFAHHRDGVLRLLGLAEGAETPRTAVAEALGSWSALAFEQAASDAGMVVAALRRFDEWDTHPQGAAIAAQPLVAIERIGDAPPLAWPDLPRECRPLEGLRVLDLTRILAGPVGTRALAAYGADVLMVNAPHLPNIEAIIDMSRGKRSAHADLRTTEGRDALFAALREAHVFVQGYRPGSLAQLGLDADTLARARPGLVQVSLSAYGVIGPWGGKRGFDSLVQTATGFNHAEAEAAGAAEPKALPMQILDMATGMLIAWGAQAALAKQRETGGSWHVKVSLARTAAWLRELGRVPGGQRGPRAEFDALLQSFPSAWGEVQAVSHAARLSRTPAAWTRAAVRPGTDRLDWNAR